MPRAASSALIHDGNDVLRFEESDDFAPFHQGHTPSVTHPDTSADPADNVELKRKQTELLQLRQELESKERETSALELHHQKEQRFANGRRDICEQITRTLVRLERELYNSQKAIEEITLARDALDRHLEVLRSQTPESWQRGNMDADLDLALAAIEDAEEEFARCSRRLDAVLSHSQPAQRLQGASSGSAADLLSADFRTCLRAGFVFTLPMALVLAITLVAMKLIFR